MSADRASVAVVGVAESERFGDCPEASSLSLHAEAAARALADAGVDKQDVDGLFTARLSPLTVAEYLGIAPTYSDGTWVGGGSFTSHMGHALAAITSGRCDVALITHGQSGRNPRRRAWSDDAGIPHGNVIDSPDPNQPSTQYEIPYGIAGAPASYALACARYMHLYGREPTRRALRSIALASREWAHANPSARMAGKLLTASSYDASPWVVWPFRRADCCLVTDGGGAVVLTRADRATDLRRQPVWVRGAAEEHEHAIISQMPDLTRIAAERTGARALAEAGLRLAEIDHVMLYDAFTYSVLVSLESLGFCGPGEGPAFIDETGIGPTGGLPVNTNGGGLSYAHTGMHGIFLIVESVRQLRGECGDRQVANCRSSLVNGIGGLLSSCSTLVLSVEAAS